MKMKRFARIAGASLAALAAACGAGPESTSTNSPPRLAVPASVQAFEGQLLSVQFELNDPDDDPLTLTSDWLPEGAILDSTTGLFAWTPPHDVAGQNLPAIVFTADDGRYTTQASMRLFVQDVNRPPRVVFAGATTVAEGQELLLNVTAHDADTEDTVTLSSPHLPPGATFEGGMLRWRPGFEQAGVYRVSFIARDDHQRSAPEVTVANVDLTVVETNRPPVVLEPALEPSYTEDQTITFRVEAHDPDQGQALGFDLQPLVDWPEAAGARLVPGGSVCDGSTATACATFYWPVPALVRGSYEFIARVTDNGLPPLQDDRTITLPIKYKNLFPVLDPVQDVSTSEGARVIIQLTGAPASPSEPDAPLESGQRLTYSVSSTPPLVGTVSMTTSVQAGGDVGTFRWDVGCAAAGIYQVEFTVADDGVPSRQAVRSARIGVAAANCAPSFSRVALADGRSEHLAPLPPAVHFEVGEGQGLAVEFDALDGDGDTGLVYAMASGPTGATFDPARRLFSWTPGCNDARPEPYLARISVSDGLATVTQTVEIVVRAANCAPRITRLCNQEVGATEGTITCPAAEGQLLGFLAVASDGDTGDAPAWSFSSAQIPSSAFDPTAGAFAWRPDCGRGGGEATATFTISDGTVSDSRTVRFPVSLRDCVPIFTTLTLVRDGQSEPPLELADTATEVMVVMDEASTVTAILAGMSLEQGQVSFEPILVPAWASFTSDEQAAYLTLPAGCRQAGSEDAAIALRDLSGTATLHLRIVVLPTNCPPTLAAVAPVTVAEMRAPLTIALEATDDDGDALTDFTFGSWLKDGVLMQNPNRPPGAVLDPATGLFTWRPGYDEAGTYRVRFRVNDHAPVGVPAVATVEVTVTVLDTNETPVLSLLSASLEGSDTLRLAESEVLILHLVGEDSDGDALTDYVASAWKRNGFAVDAPPKVALDGRTGRLTWPTGYTDAGEYEVTFILSDHHAPPPAASVERKATIVVEDSDTVPVLSTGGSSSRVVYEGAAMVPVTLTATDGDSDPLALTLRWKNDTCAGGRPWSAALSQMPGTASLRAVPFASPPQSAVRAIFEWSPGYKAADQGSAYCLEVSARNPEHYRGQDLVAGTKVDVQTVEITVIAVDTAPSLTVDAPSTQAPEGNALPAITVHAADTDSDLVSVRLGVARSPCDQVADEGSTDLPDHVLWSPSGGAGFAGGTLRWTPDYTQQGDWCFIFQARDDTPLNGTLGQSVRLDVRVLDVDTWNAVTFTDIPDGQPLVVGQRYIGSNNRPTVRGVVAAGWETSASDNVELFTRSDCSGAPAARGTAFVFQNTGLQVDGVQDGTTTTFWGRARGPLGYASACSAASIVYVEDSYAEPPLLSGTIPPTPAFHNRPLIYGLAESGSMVSIYSTPTCTGTVLASGRAEDFALGIPLPRTELAPLAENTTTTFWARTVDSVGNVSACSSETQPAGLTYANAPQWFALGATSGPSPRYNHTTVWTSKEMIVWGGFNGSSVLRTGAKYDRVTDTWTTISDPGALVEGRQLHAAVWTGQEMLVWGGTTTPATTGTGYVNSGGAFDPALGTWRPMAQAQNPLVTGSVAAPSPRIHFTAVWTGREMIVWGGTAPTDNSWVTNVVAFAKNDGGRYDPVVDAWYPVTTTGAPSARQFHSAIWTGAEMIVWGGTYTSAYYATDSGGAYSPRTNTWRPMTRPPGANGRFLHSAVWTGREMIVWGGTYQANLSPRNVLRYDPAADAWSDLPATAQAPSARFGHTAVWTGAEMAIWGGCISWPSAYANCAPVYGVPDSAYATSEVVTPASEVGGRYDPRTNTWTLTMTPTPPAPTAPAARANHTAVWTGREMIVWGGQSAAYTPVTGHGRLVYPPRALEGAPTTATNVDGWTDLSAAGGPVPRHGPAVWTGRELIVWGGEDATGVPRGDGSRFDPVTRTWTALEAAPIAARKGHTMVWTGREVIVWGGEDAGSAPLLDGAVYRPGSPGTWTPTSVAPRATGYVSDGAPAARRGHTAVWTGRVMLVWGGMGAGGTPLGSGARFDPCVNAGAGGACVDAWLTLPNTSAPSARYGHSAVWTGKEMLVWGGYTSAPSATPADAESTGGIFDMVSWRPMTVPPPTVLTPRGDHTAVWTGKEMIVWGGRDGSGEALRTGARLVPDLGGGNWIAVSVDPRAAQPPYSSLSSAGAPAARYGHSAAWNGREMLVFGGWSASGEPLALGGRYDPADDTWRIPAMPPAPPRAWAFAAWTGGGVLLYGGQGQAGLLNDVWRYGMLP